MIMSFIICNLNIAGEWRMSPWHKRRVSERAYRLWQERDQAHGHDVADWLQAEKEVAPYLRVTFDTNTLDRAVRPARFPKDPDLASYQVVNSALADGSLRGSVCDTIITLEGIQRVDRPAVFGSTGLRTKDRSEEVGADGNLRIKLELQAKQPDRKPLHPENAARLRAAHALKVKLMRSPRIGAMLIEDPDGTVYITETPEEKKSRHDLFCQVLREIERRGVGIAIAKELGARFSKRDNVQEPWFKGLGRASNIHEEGEVARAIAEWADADSVASHIAYGIEQFCSDDRAKKGNIKSIMSPDSRAWLTATYGVVYTSLTTLAAEIGSGSA